METKNTRVELHEVHQDVLYFLLGFIDQLEESEYHSVGIDYLKVLSKDKVRELVARGEVRTILDSYRDELIKNIQNVSISAKPLENENE